MVLRKDSIIERLGELDRIIHELNLYSDLSIDDLKNDLSKRWIIERGLIAAASLILDIADHILVEQYGIHSVTYEDVLSGISEKEVISRDLYQQLKGLGGFRNVLVHLYQSVNLTILWNNFQKVQTTFPKFSQEILSWLNRQI